MLAGNLMWPSSASSSRAARALMAGEMNSSEPYGFECSCSRRSEGMPASQSVLRMRLMTASSSSCAPAPASDRQAVTAAAAAASPSAVPSWQRSVSRCRCSPCRARRPVKERTAGRVGSTTSISRSSSGLRAAAANRLQTSDTGPSLQHIRTAGKHVMQGWWAKNRSRRRRRRRPCCVAAELPADCKCTLRVLSTTSEPRRPWCAPLLQVEVGQARGEHGFGQLGDFHSWYYNVRLLGSTDAAARRHGGRATAGLAAWAAFGAVWQGNREWSLSRRC